MELKLYVRMLQKGWWIIALALLSAVNVALIIDYFATPMYQAKMDLIVSPNAALTQGRDMVNSLDTLGNRSIIATYAEIIDSPTVYKPISESLPIPTEQYEQYTQVTVVLPEANVLEITVTGPDAVLVTDWANSVGQQAIKYLNSIYEVYQIDVLDVADVPLVPISPQPIRDASLAAVLGVLIGAVLAIVREQLRIPLEAFRQRRIVDGLTSAYVRSHFEKLIEDEISHTRSEEGIFSLALIQLDGLADFRETLPQPVFDRLVQDAARVLRNELRGNDIIGRLGETSFALLLPSTPYQAAGRLVSRIRWELSRPVEIPETGETLLLHPATGVVRSQDNEVVQTIMERAKKDLEDTRDTPLVAPVIPQKPSAAGAQRIHSGDTSLV